MILLYLLAATAPSPAPERIVCRSVQAPVSQSTRLHREVKVCKTRQEWRNERQFSGLPVSEGK